MSQKIVMSRDTILLLPKMREQGLTNVEIAKNLKVSVYTISYWFRRLKDAGHEIPKPNFKGGFKKIEI